MNSEALRVSELVALARRRRRALVGAGAVGAVLGVVWMVLAPLGSTSSSLVLVQGAAPVKGQLADSEAQLAVSGAVLTLAAADLGDTSVDALAKSVGAKPAGVTMVRISAEDGDRARAQRLALAVTDAYLRYAAELSENNASAATSALIPLRDNLRLQLDTADIRIAEKRNEPLLPATAPSPELAVRMPDQQVQALEGERARILADLGLVEQSISRELAVRPPHTILEPAELPGRAGLLSWVCTILLGVIAASVAAMVFLVWRVRRDPRVQDAHEIASACGAPLTAVLPGAASGLDSEAERSHYELAAHRVLPRSESAGESGTALVGVGDDTAGIEAAERMAQAAPEGTVRVVRVSRAWPLLSDLLPDERAFLVVGGGSLTRTTLLAVGGALRDAGVTPAGVFVVESREAPIRGPEERLTTVGG